MYAWFKFNLTDVDLQPLVAVNNIAPPAPPFRMSRTTTPGHRKRRQRHLTSPPSDNFIVVYTSYVSSPLSAPAESRGPTLLSRTDVSQDAAFPFRPGEGQEVPTLSMTIWAPCGTATTSVVERRKLLTSSTVSQETDRRLYRIGSNGTKTIEYGRDRNANVIVH